MQNDEAGADFVWRRVFHAKGKEQTENAVLLPERDQKMVPAEGGKRGSDMKKEAEATLQQELFPGFIEVRARTTDPDTSHEAAEALEEEQTKLQRSVRCVLKILELHGPLSDFQIAEVWPKFWGPKPWSESLPRKARLWCGERVEAVGYTNHNNRRVKTYGLAENDKGI